MKISTSIFALCSVLALTVAQQDRQGNLQGRQRRVAEFDNEFEHALGDLEDSQMMEVQDLAAATTETTTTAGRKLPGSEDGGKGRGGCGKGSGKGKGSRRRGRRRLSGDGKGGKGGDGDCDDKEPEPNRDR